MYAALCRAADRAPRGVGKLGHIPRHRVSGWSPGPHSRTVIRKRLRHSPFVPRTDSCSAANSAIRSPRRRAGGIPGSSVRAPWRLSDNRHRRRTTHLRDFVPWRFSDAGRISVWRPACLPASENLHKSGHSRNELRKKESPPTPNCVPVCVTFPTSDAWYLIVVYPGRV
jgi:hypothetical protein